MEGSIRMEREILEELYALRTRVAELEQEKQKWQKQQEQQQEQILQEHEHRSQLHEEFAQLDGRIEDDQSLALDVVFNTIADGLAVYGRKGQIVRTNQAWKQMVGTHMQPDFEQQSVEERGQSVRLRDEQGQPLARELWPVRRFLSGEVIASGDLADITFLTLDGRHIQIDISGAPVRDNTGNIVGAVAVFHDVTLRKQIAQRTEDILDMFLEMAEVLVQGIGQHGNEEFTPSSQVHQLLCSLMKLGQRITLCDCIGITLVNRDTTALNPIAVVGMAPQEMQQWQCELAHQPLSSYFLSAQLAQLQSGKVVIIDPLQARSGYLLVPMLLGSDLIGVMSLDYGAQTKYFSSEKLSLSTAVARLITLILERERMLQERSDARSNELALLESNRRMDEFLGIASHELRTPLTTINGNIQLAKRCVKSLLTDLSAEIASAQLDKLALTEELLKRAERQVRIQNRLVGDLLDVSRIQVHRLELNMQDCDLGTIVMNAIEDQRTAAAERVIRLRDLPVTGVFPPLPIYADSDRIGQVLINLLTNALKYSAADRPVEVSVHFDSERAVVKVRDEGPGLPAAELERLWERFYRVPGITVQSGSGVGLGLGLHICRTIIERHNGTVGVDSTVGSGSTFWFELPLAISVFEVEASEVEA
ncbi:PAS domain-containing sensor histidine kinase [Ktedonobacteria bacterium brp13]|nr:PAS domain-containing sensor histidine kinase [Ktedonobacteria bacterium brp13]